MNINTANSRILIIDDNRAIHEDFRKILTAPAEEQSTLNSLRQELFGTVIPKRRTADFELASAYQGEEGLDLVRRAIADGEPYAVAFVDVRMPPGWDGIETIGKIWELDPDLQIVLCSAYSDYSWPEMMEKLGHSDRLVILKKPFDTIEALQLAHALTKKWQLLQATRRKMDELEEIVHARTLHLKNANESLQKEVQLRERREHCLKLQQAVTSLLAEMSGSSEHFARNLLETLCQGMQWEFGQLWLLEHQHNSLRATDAWHLPGADLAGFQSASRQFRLAVGNDLPGRVWQSGQPVWIGNTLAEGNFLRGQLAARAGLRSAFAFPLRLQGKFLGVIEFLGTNTREPEADVVQLFSSMGSLIGQALERRTLEEHLRQSQKMEAIGQLAGGVAHDFNNMLTVIQGFVEILRLQRDLTHEVNDGLGQIGQAATRAANLTRQLLTFSRKQIIQPSTFDLNVAISNLTKMLARVIGEDIALSLNYSSEPALVTADEDMLAQIIMNLTVNSRDAMPKGGQLVIATELVTVTPDDARQQVSARGGEFVCLSVTDSGCGISAENLPRIFEPFFTTKDVGRGTGLGLSTVYGIVEQHRGWIEVNSQVGVGSVFRIFLPRTLQAPPKAIPASGSSELPRGTETILLVEDEQPVRSVARVLLQRLGYRVIEADSGKAALEIWETLGSDIDLVLTDMVMPGGISGRTLVSNLQIRRPGLKCIYASGYNPFQDNANSDLVEGVNFLQKPYHTRKLAETLRNMLDREESAQVGAA